MTTKQLEALVNGRKKPILLESELRLLLNEEDAFIPPMPKLYIPETIEEQLAEKARYEASAQRIERYRTSVVAQQLEEVKKQVVAQPKPKSVAQVEKQVVAQVKKQVVAQEVAQVTWVAQELPKPVAQEKTKSVAQVRPQSVAQATPQSVAQDKPLPSIQVKAKSKIPRVKDSLELLVEEDVAKLKKQISQIQGVDERKNFIKKIHWGIVGEKRGKKYYLFGVKKLRGRKYKLYIGNATK